MQMMYQTKKFLFNYIDEYRLQVLDLPYEEEELSMVVLLPEQSEDGSDPLQKVSIIFLKNVAFFSCFIDLQMSKVSL